jgi:benzodiazapine receptor
MNESQSSCPTPGLARSTAGLAIGLAVWIMICFSAAAIGGFATTSSVGGWYAEINKPSWNPPDWIFGPVWSALYLMMAIAAWLVWKSSTLESTRVALGWFVFHLLLNVFWSVLFFGLQQPGWAFVEIIALWISIMVAIVLFYRHSKIAAGLLVPYLCWVTFASVLNYTIWSINPVG